MGTRTARRILLPLLLAALGILACQTVEQSIDPITPGELDLWDDAAAGVLDEDLQRLVVRAWDEWLRAHPIEATLLGDPRYADRLPNPFQNEIQRRTLEIEEMRRALAQLTDDRLAASDRLTRDLLDLELEKELTRLQLGLFKWQVDPVAGPHLVLFDLATKQRIRTALEREAFVKRWRAAGAYLRQTAQNLSHANRRGMQASHGAIDKTLDQLEEIIAGHPMDMPMVRMAAGGGTWAELPPGGSVAVIAHKHLGDSREQRLLRRLNPHLLDSERIIRGTRVLLPGPADPLTPEERGKFLYDVIVAVEDDLLPGMIKYRDALLRVLPSSRDDDRAGLLHVPNGDVAYRALIREYTSLPAAECDPRAIHEYGLAEVARIRREIAEQGEGVFGTRDVAEIQRRMRHDPDLHFQSREEVATTASNAMFRARVRAAEFFGLLPETECEVAPVPAYAERDTATAYYRLPDAIGTRPGYLYVNTYAPETRPRYEAEARAFHESIPGHHLQGALQQELSNLPRFRRHLGSAAFVQGWALYAQDLCGEMGLYSSDTDRLGALSIGAWSACRLVADTGIHAFGWSRDQAIGYLYENTLLSAAEVETEVDRIIAAPAEALAHKIGAREILALRDRAVEILGAGFSYPRFHDRVLHQGAVPMPVLRNIVGNWLGLSVTESDAR